MSRNSYTSSFTLIELLIVIGILAILTAAVVIVLNPTELLKQGRDSTRMTDLASLSKTIQLLLTQNPSVSLGTASTVYISIPDTSTICVNLGLPSLPSGYTYRCVSSASSTLINGTGWLPIDFTSSIQSISKLPIDPSNVSSTSLYYTYTPNPTTGTFELTTSLESNKYAYKEAQDGGVDLAQYEIGSNLTLSPFTHGLVGYWKFDEGTGVQALDSSGYNNTGTLTNGPTWQIESNCKSGKCLSFDGVSTYVNATTPLTNLGNNITLNIWINRTGATLTFIPLVEQGGTRRFRLIKFAHRFCFGNDSTTDNYYCTANIFSSTNIWYHIAAVFDGTYHVFVNGVEYAVTQITASYGSWATNQLNIGYRPYDASVGPFNGYIDDVRIYNRALSPAEILALYNATK